MQMKSKHCQMTWLNISVSIELILDLIEPNKVFLADEESFFQNNQPPQEWEDFASVASDLLEYLQSSVQVNENERSLE